MNVYFDLQGGAGWENVTPLVRDTISITHRACSNDYKYAINIADMTLLYDADLFTRLHATLGYVLVRVMEDDDITYAFVGQFTPLMELSYNGILDLQSIQITAEDYTSRLDVSMSEFTQEDLKIMDPTDETNSIVHNLFTHLGLSHSLIDPSVSILDVVGAVATEDDSSALDFLSTMMYEYGWVPNWNRSGLFSPIRWIQPSGLVPTIEFNDYNIIDSIEESTQEIEYESAKVYWYGLGEREDTRVYTENLKYDEDGDFEGYAVLHTTFFPDEANVIDDTTGDYQIVEQDYQDTGIRYGTSKYIELEYAQDFALEHADFTRILITKNHVCYDRTSPLLVRDRTTFYNRKAEIRYWNGTGDTEWLYYMHIDADIVYTKSRNTCLVEYVAGSKKINAYDTSYVYDIVTADRLVKAMASSYRLGRYFYKVRSEEAYEEGSFVAIETSNGISATGIILERQYDDLTKIYSYSIRGYDTNYLGVAERTVRISSLSGNDATNIAVQTPKHAGSVDGNATFRYYPGETTPVTTPLVLTFRPSNSDWVPTSYQWYYISGGTGHIITGETASTLSVAHDASYLNVDATTVYVLVDGRYIFTSTILKLYDQPAFQSALISGVYGLSYAMDESAHAPWAADRCYAKFYENDIEMPTASGIYAWTAGGGLTISGVSNLDYADVLIDNTIPTTPTFIECSITYNGRVAIAHRDIPVSFFETDDMAIAAAHEASIRMDLSTAKISRARNGVLTPSGIVLTSLYGDDNTSYAGRFQIEVSTDGTTYSGVYQSSVDESSHFYDVPVTVDSDYVVAVKCSLYKADGFVTKFSEKMVPLDADITSTPMYWGARTTAPTLNIQTNDYYFDSNTVALGGGVLRYYTGSAWAEMTSAHALYMQAMAAAITDMMVWASVQNETIAAASAVFGSIAASVAFVQNLFAQYIEVPDGGRMRYYNGQGVRRRAVELSQDHIDWIDTPDTTPASDELLRGRIGRLGVGSTILVDGDFQTNIEMPWSAVSVVNGAESTYLSGIVLANGNILVAYQRMSDHKTVCKSSSDNGSTWGAEAVVSNVAYDVSEPYLYQLADGSIGIAYAHLTSLYTCFRKSTDGGATWGSEILINDVEGSEHSLVQLKDLTLICSYRGPAPTRAIYFKRSMDGGATWSSTQEDVDGSASGGASSLLLLNNGSLMCTYVRVGTTILVQRSSLDDGVTWDDEIVINNAASAYGKAVELVNNNLLCTYRSLVSPFYLVQRISVDYGATWGEETTISTEGCYESYVIQTSQGAILCLYRRTSDSFIVERILQRYARLGAGIIASGQVTNGFWRAWSDGTVECEQLVASTNGAASSWSMPNYGTAYQFNAALAPILCLGNSAAGSGTNINCVFATAVAASVAWGALVGHTGNYYPGVINCVLRAKGRWK